MSKIETIAEFLAAVKALSELPQRVSVFIRYNPFDFPGFCELIVRAGGVEYRSAKHRCSLKSIVDGLGGYMVLGKRKIRNTDGAPEVDAPVEVFLVPQLEELGIEVEFQAHKDGDDREAAKLEEMGPERYAARERDRKKAAGRAAIKSGMPVAAE